MIKLIMLVFLSLLIASCNSGREISLIIGSLAQNITQVKFQTGSESFNKPQVLIKTDQPTFFVQKDFDHIYVVNNVERGILKSYKRDGKNQYQELNWKSIRGSEPNYLALHSNNNFLAVANYSGRNLPIMSFLKDGGIDRVISRDMQSGSSLDPVRQKTAHITWVGWNLAGDKLYSTNLGADTIGVNQFVRGTGELKKGEIALSMKAGDGPRVMSFNQKQDRAYILNELSNMITVAKVNSAGLFDSIQRIKLTTSSENEREHKNEQISVMVISPAGDYLYASNAGRALIEVFKIVSDGQIEKIASVSSQGQRPSAFYIDEKNEYFFVSNETSNTVNVFRIDSEDKRILIPLETQLNIKAPAHIVKKLDEKKGGQ